MNGKVRLASPVASVLAAGSSGPTGAPVSSTRSSTTSSSHTCRPSPRAQPTACTPISVDPHRLCTGASHASRIACRSSSSSGSELVLTRTGRMSRRPAKEARASLPDHRRVADEVCGLGPPRPLRWSRRSARLRGSRPFPSPAQSAHRTSGVLACGGSPPPAPRAGCRRVRCPSLFARLQAPCQARDGDEELPVPHVDAAHAARPAGTEDLLVSGCVRKPLLLSQNPFGASRVESGTVTMSSHSSWASGLVIIGSPPGRRP